MSSLRCTIWALTVENREKYEDWMCSVLCKNTMNIPKACLRVAQCCNSVSTLTVRRLNVRHFSKWGVKSFNLQKNKAHVDISHPSFGL